MLPPNSFDQIIERIVKEEWGRILSCVVKNVGDIQLAEDGLQDAVEAALKTWPVNGMPKSPAAWLIAASHRKVIDRIRRETSFARKRPDLKYLTEISQLSDEYTEKSLIPDERLEMIFTCCHPALEEKTRVALTLRTIGGLTTDEIARAFLDNPTAMAQRLVRAKKKIKLAGIPYCVPVKEALPIRLSGVLAVIYLIFNEGYSVSAGDQLTRVDLINEAMRLARILMSLMPNEPEVLGLYALLQLHDSRRRARLDEQGAMVALEFQNRRVWDQQKAEVGNFVLKNALELKSIGPYQLQACISALHVEAKDWNSTDWPQISALYALLYRMQPTTVVKINHAIAVSYAVSVEAALQMVSSMEEQQDISANISFLLTKADLYERSGRRIEALEMLKKAASLAENDIEKEFILRKSGIE